MKKIVLLLVVVLALTSVQAQETMYGVRGGIGLSSLSFDQDIEFDNEDRLGAFFGGFVDFGISERFSIMTEANFSAEGAKDEPLQLDMIQLPVQLRYALSDDVKLGVGPQFSFVTWDNQNIFSQYAFSVVGGLELMVSDMFFIDFRYTYGLTNVLEEPTTNEANNSSFQLGFGIKL
jgi:opacity protein-like surface antigen